MTMSPPVPDDDRLPPARFALDPWTWKEISYLLSNLPMALAGFVYTVFMIGVGVGLSVTVIGLPLLAAGLQGRGCSGGRSGAGPGGCSGYGSTSRARWH